MKEKDKGGRPPIIMTVEQVAQIEALASFLNIEQISGFMGFSENTFKAIRDRQPEVVVAYKKGRSKAIAGVGKGLLQNALDGDTTSQIFYLKTQAGWSEKQLIEHSEKVTDSGDTDW